MFLRFWEANLIGCRKRPGLRTDELFLFDLAVYSQIADYDAFPQGAVLTER